MRTYFSIYVIYLFRFVIIIITKFYPFLLHFFSALSTPFLYLSTFIFLYLFLHLFCIFLQLNKPFLYDWEPWKWFKNKEIECLINWNRETLKGDFSLANSWFKDNREKVFCIGLWLEKWIFYDNPKKKYYAKPDQSLPSTSTSTPRPNIGSKIMLCIYWWDQKGLFYYELLKPGDSITSDWYRLQLIRLNRIHCKKNGRNKDMIKLFFFMIRFGLMSLKS